MYVCIFLPIEQSETIQTTVQKHTQTPIATNIDDDCYVLSDSDKLPSAGSILSPHFRRSSESVSSDDLLCIGY